jgi:LysM repeat protein
MSRKLFARMVVVLLIVGVLVGLLPLSALAGPPGPGGPPAPASGGCHWVQCGETLWGISLRYHTTVWAIAQANGIRDVNRIRAGQCLVIPEHDGGHDDGGHHGEHHGIVYIVMPGDTLSGVAWRFGIPVRVLAQANHIWNYNLIYIYQKLYIP